MPTLRWSQRTVFTQVHIFKHHAIMLPLTHNHAYRSDIDEDGGDDEIDGDDETIFNYKLGKLKKEAQVFLQMLNDMRRRARELPPESPVTEQYKYIAILTHGAK